MMRILRLLTALAALGGCALAPVVALAVGEESPPLAPGDFAHARALETTGDAAVHTALLDAAVYEGVVEPRLADLRVFNADGEAVPHAIRALADPSTESARIVELPLFVVPDEPADDAPTRTAAAGYAMDVELSDSGAILRVRSGAGEAATSEQAENEEEPAPAGYLIDASQIARPIDAIELELSGGRPEFVTSLRVEGSDDLVRFAPVVAHAAIVRLDQRGHRIERTRIELGGSRRDYLRIRWAGAPLPAAITRVEAELARRTAPPERERATFDGTADPDEPGVHVFDLGGEIPVDRIQIELPQPNTVVEARIESAATIDGPWRQRFDGLLYSFEGDEPVRNRAIGCAPMRDRFVRLVVSPKGGGLGRGEPRLEAAWLPEQLLFVARGPAPYTLAYGRAEAERTAFDASRLLAISRSDGAALPRESARLGTPRRVAGDDVLRASDAVAPKTVMLWALLVAIVGFVLVLSARLVREMG